MNPNHENELEALIDRELKALPQLSAPDTLASRIMTAAAVEQRLPWYQAGWQAWPLSVRIASFAALLALFVGLCFGGSEISQTKGVTEAGEKVSRAFSLISLASETLSVLKNAAVLVVQHIGPGYVIAALAVMAAAYALCIALGSFYVRFAFARR